MPLSPTATTTLVDFDSPTATETLVDFDMSPKSVSKRSLKMENSSSDWFLREGPIRVEQRFGMHKCMLLPLTIAFKPSWFRYPRNKPI